VTLFAGEILGDDTDPRFAGRVRERLRVASHDAAKRRLRATTDAGTDIAVDLPRGSFLCHGAVIADDGARIVVVDRVPEEALVLRFSSELSRNDLVAAAARLGHAFGNQHVPIAAVAGEIRVPLTTSREIAARTVRALGLDGVDIRFEFVRLAAERPLTATPHLH
jgi:urease accessory protein